MPPKIVNYYLVYAVAPDELSNRITLMLAKGWLLYGDPSISYADCSCRFAQAMVRYEEVAK